MKSTLYIDGEVFECDLGTLIDISIPLRFNGSQPNAFGVEPASSKACESGTLIGDTRRGGSCNFEQYTFIPHCNGTHTECVGHITNERIAVRDCLRDVLVPGILVSVEPVPAIETGETYAIEFGRGDTVVTETALQTALASTAGDAPQNPTALVIRTLPNDDSKLTRNYNETNISPYFTTEAMQFISERGFEHMLVDLPSIDRLFDEGKLSNHRIFWNVEQGSFETKADSKTHSTITEMIYVPNNINDGQYLLNLQIAPFESDAAPSRPVLFRVPPLDG